MTGKTLETQLRALREERDRIHARTRELLTRMEPHPVDHDEVTGNWRFSEVCHRYAIVFPDGRLYDSYQVPGVAHQWPCYAQRPAALRAIRTLPGARVYDTRTRTIIYPEPS
jgi:hypothetical protein